MKALLVAAALTLSLPAQAQLVGEITAPNGQQISLTPLPCPTKEPGVYTAFLLKADKTPTRIGCWTMIPGNKKTLPILWKGDSKPTFYSQETFKFRQ